VRQVSVYIVFIIAMMPFSLWGQCNYEGEAFIDDNSNFSIDVLVSGATNDDLSSNCLQAVLVDFEHDFLTDLTIELESPSGQKVVLVGADAIGPNTGLGQSWDIKFFNETELTAIPDPDHDQVWNSISPWIAFTTFTGSYYPYGGSLEDFTGSVNGIWKVNLSDNSPPFTGNFFCLGLVFCDDDGIEIESCSPVSSDLTEGSLSFCENDPQLDITLNPVIEEEYDDELYFYKYLRFDNGAYAGITTSTDFTGEAVGTYSICGIHYFFNDEELIENIPLGADYDGVKSYLSSVAACMLLSDNCVDITILPVPEVITSNQSICIGDSIEVGGQFYSEAGIYEIITPTSPCDSVSMLNLEIIFAEILFEQNFDSLSCENDTILLSGANSTFPEDAFFRWTTVDGNIVSSETEKEVYINKGGTYVFEIELNGCRYIDEISVGEKKDFSFTRITAGVIGCIDIEQLVDLETEDDIDSINWEGPASFEVQDEDIIVTNAGVYVATFETEHGCTISQSVEVLDERDVLDFNLVSGTLTCDQSEVTIFNTVEDTFNSTYIWIFDDEVLSFEDTITVSNPGEYTFRVTTENGCVDSFLIDVPTLVQEIDMTLVTEDISCENQNAQISYMSDIQGLDVVWTLPNGNTIIDSVFTTTTPGAYNLFLSDGNGCNLDSSFVIQKDTLIPEVAINATIFQCGQDSVQMSAVVNSDDLSYRWTNPSGFVDTTAAPFVYGPGTFYLEVCRDNGCCSSDTTFVFSDQAVPDLIFETANLDCANDTVYIVPNDTSTYEMNWQRNGNDLTVDSNIIQVISPSFYEVEVINPDNGCKSRYTFNITRDEVDTLISLSSDILNCENETVTIELEKSRDFEIFIWSGPGLMDFTESPSVNLPGKYVIDYIYANGCVGRDSIEIISEGQLPNLTGNNQLLTCTTDTVELEVFYETSTISVTWDGPNNFSATGAQTIGTEPGIYTAFAVAPGACRDTIQINVAADTISPQIIIANDGKITCSDSIVTIDLTVDGATTSFEFDGPGIIAQNGTQIEVDKPGLYSATALADNGCETKKTTTVDISTDFPVYTILLDSITCDDDEVLVGISSDDSALSVDWSGPQAVNSDSYDFLANTAGNYQFSLTNSDGCTIEDSFFVVRDTFVPLGGINLANMLTCDKDDALFSINDLDPSWTIEWGGPGVINPLDNSFTTDVVGEYTLRLTGRNGCIIDDTTTLVYDTIPADIDIIGDPITCLAGKIFLRIDSDLAISNYEWTGPNAYTSDEVEPLIFEGGTYNVTITSENGCISFDDIFVEDERVFPDIEVGDFYLPCDGAPALATYTDISDNAVVRWFGPNDYFSDLDTASIFIEGEYVGVAISDEGCTFADTFQIIDEPIYPEFGGFGDLLLCKGPIDITATDADDDRSIEWIGPQGYQSFDNPASTETPGDYILYVTGTNGCVDSMIVVVEDGREYPDAEATLNQPFQCLNTTVNLSGNGSSAGSEFSYQWFTTDGEIVNGEKSLSPLITGEGDYILQVTNDLLGCITRDTIEIREEPQSFTGVNLMLTPPSCAGYDNAIIEIEEYVGGYGPYEVVLDGNQYGQNMNLQYLMDGEHQLTITDSLGCEIDSLVIIDMSNVLTLSLPEDTTLILGNIIDIDPMINLTMDSIMSIVWSDPGLCDGCATIEGYEPTDNITITVTVEDINGCIEEDEFRITLDRPNNPAFPQIFTPNNDGNNDIFYLPMTTGISQVDFIRVYDTWGGLMFESAAHEPGNPMFGWDGTINGQLAGEGVYIVESIITLIDNKKVRYTGDVTLIR